MSAETLRKAAALMRERAEAATPGPWGWHYYDGPLALVNDSDDVVIASEDEGEGDRLPWLRVSGADQSFVQDWHPAVALAVADWLDTTAAGWPWDDEVADLDGNPLTLAESVDSHAITVARAYLGETE